MMPEQRKEILGGIRTMCRIHPSYRLCQMVANTAFVGCDGPNFVLENVQDDQFLEGLHESIRQGRTRLGDDAGQSHEGDTLPALLPQISEGLEELSEHFPRKPFVPLVMQVAEWTKEFAPFDFWDVEDADFLRALRTHLSPSAAAS